MKKITAPLFLSMLFLLATPVAHADEGFFDWLFTFEGRNEIKPVTDELYNEECGDCHLAYQPGLLPEQSWRKLLSPAALEDHFGENAEEDDETLAQLLDFAVKNSADKSRYKRSKKIMASLRENRAPLRITEVPYIRRKHHEISDDLISKNEKVKSLSYCDACHQQAEQGVYDDDTVNIPGYGDWTW